MGTLLKTRKLNILDMSLEFPEENTVYEQTIVLRGTIKIEISLFADDMIVYLSDPPKKIPPEN